MFAPRVTEIRRLSAHHRQVVYVRAPLLRGINYGDAPPNNLEAHSLIPLVHPPRAPSILNVR